MRGRDLGAVARDVEAALTGVQFNAGYHPEVLGEYAVQDNAVASATSTLGDYVSANTVKTRL